MVTRFAFLRQVSLAALALCALSSLAGAQEVRQRWVVVGFHPGVASDAYIAEMTGKAKACQVRLFWDFAAKFDGFSTKADGNVFVVDGHDRMSKAAADKLLAQTRPCFADAYIKQALYLGE